VNYNGTWGTVCANGFTDAAASVVCHSLGRTYVLLDTCALRKSLQFKPDKEVM